MLLDKGNPEQFDLASLILLRKVLRTVYLRNLRAYITVSSETLCGVAAIRLTGRSVRATAPRTTDHRARGIGRHELRWGTVTAGR